MGTWGSQGLGPRILIRIWQRRWGRENPQRDWFCGGWETRSPLTNMASEGFLGGHFWHLFYAALSWVLLLLPTSSWCPCSGCCCHHLLSSAHSSDSEPRPQARAPPIQSGVGGWGGEVEAWLSHAVMAVVAPRRWLSWHMTAP